MQVFFPLTPLTDLTAVMQVRRNFTHFPVFDSIDGLDGCIASPGKIHQNRQQAVMPRKPRAYFPLPMGTLRVGVRP